MKFTRFHSVQEYADTVTDILKKNEIQNNLFFLNIKGGLAREDLSGTFMAVVRDDAGEICLSSIRTAPTATRMRWLVLSIISYRRDRKRTW